VRTQRSLSYAIVTPARNEVANLPRLAAAVLAQTQRPATWVIVDDLSADGTDVWARALATRHAFIHAVARVGPDVGVLAEGRHHARDLLAFRAGIDALPTPVDVVVKADADTDFGPRYFEDLLAQFAARPDLGIASGGCHERKGGAWIPRSTAVSHPRGGSREYRWALVEDVRRLEPRMGWDGLDEVLAGLRGYQTRQFPELVFRHHRPVGGRDRSRLRSGSLSGRASWFMGYRLSFLVLRALHRTREDPTAIAMVWGYCAEALQRAPRCADARVVAIIRQRQALRTLLREGFPARTCPRRRRARTGRRTSGLGRPRA